MNRDKQQDRNEKKLQYSKPLLVKLDSEKGIGGPTQDCGGGSTPEVACIEYGNLQT